MIPAKYEDRVSSSVYAYLQKKSQELNAQEFALLFRTTYDNEKYKKHNFFSFKPKDLCDELFLLAYTCINTPEQSRRRVDAKALRTIKKRKSCNGKDPVAINYFRQYKDMKDSLTDMTNGVVYIEDQVEFDECSVIVYNEDSLESKLSDYAYRFQTAKPKKKRKINRNAMLTIRRCSSCKNNPEAAQEFYKFYIRMKKDYAVD